MMQQVTVDRNLREITQLIDLRISGDIVVEAGAQLLGALIDAQVIEILELSISPIAGDGGFIDLDALLSDFEIIDEEVIDETRLLKCRYNRYSTDS
jgi:riboflavin biosynthesis pyrimidine reductase